MRLRDHAAYVDALSRTPAVGVRSDREHTLHELCHAATLGLEVDHSLARLGMAVSGRLCRLNSLESDWNEIWTCAAEIRAAEILGWPWFDASILGGNLDNFLSESYAMGLIEARVGTERAYTYAARALRLAPVALEYAEAAKGIRDHRHGFGQP